MNEYTPLKDRCNALGLKGMAEALEDISRLQPSQRPGLRAGVQKLLERETYLRENRKFERLFKRSKLRMRVYVRDIECSAERNLTQDQLEQITDFDNYRNGENLLITGQTGVGKTYLGNMLGTEACIRGFKVIYLDMTRLIEQIKKARDEGSYMDYADDLARYDMIIIDEFGHTAITNEALLVLLSLLDSGYQQKSMVIISQLSAEDIYTYLAECSATTADAIMDRLRTSAMHIHLTGPSMRSPRKN